MLNIDFTEFKVSEGKVQNKTVVRLRTTVWADGKGIYQKRSLTFLRRQNLGFSALEEDVSAVGAESAIHSITNLDQCYDGIYEVIVCDVSHDYETGYVDDWSYRLVPVQPEKGEQ